MSFLNIPGQKSVWVESFGIRELFFVTMQIEDVEMHHHSGGYARVILQVDVLGEFARDKRYWWIYTETLLDYPVQEIQLAKLRNREGFVLIFDNSLPYLLVNPFLNVWCTSQQE